MIAAQRPPQVRVFIAACLDPGLLAQIRQRQQALARRLAPVQLSWTRPEQLHLTLKFFGNVPIVDLATVEAAIRAAATGKGPFALAVQGWGCFPSARHPRVLWLGLHGEIDRLQFLQHEINEETGAFGSHSETRPFHPHLTVARIRTLAPGEADRLAETLHAEPAGEFGQWTVREVTLMKSQLSGKGSVYTALATIPLV